MASFTPEEKVRIRHHLGYLNVQNAQTFVLGTPAAVQTQFQIEGAMDRLLEAAMPTARNIIQVLDTIESQMVNDLELLSVLKVDEIDINNKEQEQLKTQYQFWQNSLSNLMGVYPNPFDKRFNNATMGMNIPVFQ